MLSPMESAPSAAPAAVARPLFAGTGIGALAASAARKRVEYAVVAFIVMTRGCYVVEV